MPPLCFYSMSIIELLGLACLCLAWLLPNHYLPWNSFYNDSLAALGLGMLVLVAVRAGRRAVLPRPVWGVAAIALIPWLQWCFGLLRFSGDAFISSLYLLGLAVAIAVGYVAASGEPRRFSAALSGVMVVGATISSLIALTQALEVGVAGIWTLETSPGMRVYANLAQPNNLATLIGFGAIGLWLLCEQERVGRVAAIGILAVLLIGASLTQSRTALLFGPCVAIVVFAQARRGKTFRVGFTPVLAATTCHVALTWAWPAVQQNLLLAATESLNARGVESIRFQVWPMLMDALSMYPWCGYGWLQVGSAELAVANRFPPVGELWLHGHNLFIELLVWCGYPLGLLLAGLIVWWFLSRALKVRTVEGVAAILIITVLLVHSMLELPYHYAYFLIPAGLWIGIAEASLATAISGSPRWNMLPVAVSGLLLFAVWHDYPAVEEDFRLVRFENLRIGSLRAKQPAPNAPFLSTLTAFLRFARTTPEKGMPDDKLAEMREVVQRYPYSGAMFRLASSYALNGRLQEAHDLFIGIRHIHGQAMYASLKRSLHDRIAEGELGLLDLERSLPD